jgi:hypothetical protein
MMRCLVLAGIVLAGLLAAPAVAQPVDAEQCIALDAEQKSLERAGVAQQIALDPEAAKVSSLSEEEVARLTRYLEVKETVLFRCPNLQPVVLPDPKQGDIISGPPDEPAGAKKKSDKKPARSAKVKPAAVDELGQSAVP